MRKILISPLFYLISIGLSAQDKNSDVYSTLYNDAVKLMSGHEYVEARQKLGEAIELRPDFAEAIFARGTCSLMLKEWDLACADFDKSARLNWKPSFEYLEKYCGKDSYGRKVNRSKK